jgi:predicted nucleic acid-binding protein
VIAPYLDASAIIYLVEGAASAQALVARRIAGAEQDPAGRVLTSHLSRLECRVKPLRASDVLLLSTYDAFFTRARLEVLDISAAVIDRATDLRARYGFKTPDAIHLACAIGRGADVFVTGDAMLGRCEEIRIEIVSPIASP